MKTGIRVPSRIRKVPTDYVHFSVSIQILLTQKNFKTTTTKIG